MYNTNCRLCNKSLNAHERLALYYLTTDESPSRFLIPVCFNCYRLPKGTKINA